MNGEDMTLWNEETPPKKRLMAWWGWLATFAVGIAVAFLTYQWGKPPATALVTKKPLVAVTREWSEYLPNAAQKTDAPPATEAAKENLTEEEQQASVSEDQPGAEEAPAEAASVPPADDVAERFNYELQETPPVDGEVKPEAPTEEQAATTVVPEAEVTALKEELAVLEKRIAALEKEKESEQKSSSLFERLYRLRMKIEHGERADEVIATLKDLSLPEEQTNILVMLDDLNRQGIPPRAVLVRQFSERADQYATAPEEGASVVKEAESWLKKQIVIRKVGDTHKGTDDGSVIARAEAFVKAGKIKEALAETDTLSTNGQRFFAAWRAEAERRLQADSLVEQLEKSVAAMSRAS